MVAKIGRADATELRSACTGTYTTTSGSACTVGGDGRGVGPGGEADGRGVEEPAGECVGVGAERVTQHGETHEHEIAERVGRVCGNGQVQGRHAGAGKVDVDLVTRLRVEDRAERLRKQHAGGRQVHRRAVGCLEALHRGVGGERLE